MRSIWVVMVLVVAASSCSSDSTPSSASDPPVVDLTTTEASSATSTTVASVDVPGSGDGDCNQTPVDWSIPEVQGIAINATIYGLLFLTHVRRVHAGEELKIVWRMTGSGDLSVRYFAPDGREGVLVFGPSTTAAATTTDPATSGAPGSCSMLRAVGTSNSSDRSVRATCGFR